MVDSIDGAPLSAAAEVDITFDMAQGRVSGKSACNRYTGAVSLTGEGLSFGNAAGTMMACPEDLMAVEQAFLGGLSRIDRFDLTADGALQLISADQVVITARR
jgi:heat shock protein HslJ